MNGKVQKFTYMRCETGAVEGWLREIFEGGEEKIIG